MTQGGPASWSVATSGVDSGAKVSKWRDRGGADSLVAVARECFCGCGRDIPKFPLGMRAINKRGRLVDERLEWGKALFGTSTEFDEWFGTGEAILGDLQAAMHGELNPRSLDEDEVRQWQVYGRNMERVAVENGLPGVNAWLRADDEP